MSTKFLPHGLQEVFTFTSTLGVGSTYTGTAFSTKPFQSYVGICAVDSSNITLAFQQSTNSGTNYDVSSTIVNSLGVITLNFTTLGNVGRFNITTVTSTQGETFRIAVYGIPTS